MSGAPDPYADFASPTESGGDPYAAIAAPVAAAGPRSDYGGDRVSDKSLGDLVAESMGVQPGSEAYLKRKAYGHRADRWIDAGIRGATDAATFGYADELAAGLESIPAIFSDHETLGQAYKRHVADERAIDQADQEDLPVTRGAGELGGVGVTMAGSLIAAPGRLVSRGLMQNALRGAGEGAAYGGLSSSGHAEGNPLERGKAAIPGALAGAALGGVLAPVADAAGGAINALRTRGGSELDRAANALRGRVDVPAARLRANALTDAGAEPTAVSAMDESGRGFVRAAASRMTPGREVVQQRAEAASLNLPDRIGQQARRTISSDPRTPQQIAEELGAARASSANANFGAVRADVLPIDADMAAALSHPMGREAIAEAARRERDPAVRQALLQLPGKIGQEGAQLTVGMADRISRTLLGKAQAAARTGDNDLAATYSHLADSVRGPARSASPGYDAALGDYAKQSQIMDAAGQGEDFLKRNTDEFVAQTPGPGQEGNDLARATARRAVERAAGENVSAAPGVARKLAFAPEQQARSRAILGDEGAQRMEAGMAAEARTTRDLNDVAPRTGSQTQLRAADQAAVSKVASAVHTIMGGAPAWGVALLGRLKTAGLNDADAEAVAKVATDPAQLQDLLARMERMKPGSGDALLSVLHVGVAESAGGVAQPAPAIELNISRSTNPEFLAAQAKRGLIWDEQAGHFVKKAP